MSLSSSIFDVAKTLVGGAAGGWFSSWLVSRRQKQEAFRSAQSLAITIVAQLERYAVKCANIRSEHELWGPETPQEFNGIVAIPELDGNAEKETGWQALDPRLAVAIYRFRSTVDHSRWMVSWVSDTTADATQIAAEVEKEAARLGVSAIDLAKEFRERYAVGKASWDWDIEAHLNSEVARFQEAQRQLIEEKRLRDQSEVSLSNYTG